MAVRGRGPSIPRTWGPQTAVQLSSRVRRFRARGVQPPPHPVERARRFDVQDYAEPLEVKAAAQLRAEDEALAHEVVTKAPERAPLFEREAMIWQATREHRITAADRRRVSMSSGVAAPGPGPAAGSVREDRATG